MSVFGHSDWHGTVTRKDAISELPSDGLVKEDGNFAAHVFNYENKSSVIFQYVRTDYLSTQQKLHIRDYDDFSKFVELVNETKRKLDELRK